jgi:hypothetical protein
MKTEIIEIVECGRGSRLSFTALMIITTLWFAPLATTQEPAAKAKEEQSKSALEKIRKEANQLLVMPDSLTPPVYKQLTVKDADAIAKECPAIESAAFYVRARFELRVGEKKWTPTFINGTTPSYLDVRGWRDLAEGKPFNDAEVRDQALVCLIGQTVKRELFGKESPIGKEIRVPKGNLKVVGVLGTHGHSAIGLDFDDVVLVPWTTLKERLSNTPPAKVEIDPSINTLVPKDLPSKDAPPPSLILARTRKIEDNDRAVRQITDLMRKRHQLKAGVPDDFVISDMAATLKLLKQKDR